MALGGFGGAPCGPNHCLLWPHLHLNLAKQVAAPRTEGVRTRRAGAGASANEQRRRWDPGGVLEVKAGLLFLPGQIFILRCAMHGTLLYKASFLRRVCGLNKRESSTHINPGLH